MLRNVPQGVRTLSRLARLPRVQFLYCVKKQKNVAIFSRKHSTASPVTEPTTVATRSDELKKTVIAENKSLNSEGGIPSVQLGDYVEVFRNTQYRGIVVQKKKVGGGMQQISVFCSARKTIDIRSDSIAFSIPGEHFRKYVKSPLEIDETGEKVKNIPLEYDRAIKTYWGIIKTERSKAYSHLDQMYAHFIKQAALDDDKVTVTLEDLAKYAFGEKQLLEKRHEVLHATFTHVVDDNIRFIPTLYGRSTGKWELRSRNSAKELQQLVDWIRSRDATYTGFLDRTRALVEFYQSNADPIYGTIPSSCLKAGKKLATKLTETDNKFINFFVDWIKAPEVVTRSLPHGKHCPTILKALGCYSESNFVDQSQAVTFLKQVGMFKPWDNITLVDNADSISEFVWSDKSKESQRKMQQYADAFLGADNIHIAGFSARDTCDAIRHDFGDTPVYTIDDPSAKEIDDGISIEHVPGEDATWLHVHIADPSAYISPGHELAQLMQDRIQTLYLPECHFPILPEALASAKFSLGVSAQSAPNRNGSQYAMSFSTKLSKDGTIKDWKVRPSLVKNVVKVYYNDLDRLLKPLAPVTSDPLVDLTKTYSHPTSEKALEKRNGNTVQKPHEKNLMDLYYLTRKHYELRKQNGAIQFSRPSAQVSLSPCPLDIPNIQFSTPEFASNIPTVCVSLDRSSSSPARLMVAETMIIGGRIVSQFAREHGVPLPFRTQTWDENSDPELLQELLDSRDPVSGMVKFTDMLRYAQLFTPASITTVAGRPHAIMGINDGYVKATSPLRRYLDIVVHWQLKAHLLKEKPPFTVDDLNRFAPKVEAREKLLSYLGQRGVHHWVTQLLQRYNADNQDKVWTCIAVEPDKVSYSELGGAINTAAVTILELGIRGRVENLENAVHTGDIMKVRVKKIDPLTGFVNLAIV
ncbi:hypothetical protein DFQ28_011488 [Apophysomyces sp. BC1034]|nr:hypothetical protein DFQ30_011497 [Apophysomyces sp. BC1015]KAG0168717.1 hypothetical protein DFQ29_010044 [Apophysomyces sp. BC1021]KAG0184265.1 hypothetical protein DFQ28_011488 [Apophysomyces sp. BC1034]